MARCRGRVQLSGPWQGEGRAEPHVPRSRGSSRVSGGAPGHESKGRLDRSAHFQDPKCKDGGCEHLRASVSQGTHQEGHQPGGVGEEVVSSPGPAQPSTEVEFTAPSVFPGTFQGKRHRGHQPLSVCPGPSPAHRGSPLRAAQGPGCSWGCCPEISVHATQAYVVTYVRVNTQIPTQVVTTHTTTAHTFTHVTTHM